MKVRPAMSMLTLDESLAKTREVHSRAELMRLLQDEYSDWHPNYFNVKCRFYTYDDRCKWQTYLITIGGEAAAFADGPIP